jgi:hypothetical protein
MESSFVNIYKQVLDASYDVYGDINRINAAILRATMALGLKSIPIPTLAGQSQKQPPAEETTKVSLPTSPKLVYENVPIASSEKNKGKNEKVEHVPISAAIEVPIEMQARHSLEQQSKPKTITPTLKPIGKTPAAEIDVAVPTSKFSANPTEKQTSAQQEVEIKKLEQDKLSTETVMPSNISEIQAVQIAPAEISDNNLSDNPISNLLKLVKSKGSLTISDAAAILGVKRSLVEQWAKILNKNSLIRLKYQLVGDTIIEV